MSQADPADLPAALTLIQAIAWMMTRDADFAALPNQKALDLEKLTFERSTELPLWYLDAKAALLTAIKAGKVNAYGSLSANMKPSPIAARLLVTAKIWEGDKQAEEALILWTADKPPSRPLYRKVTVDRDQVFALWPAPVRMERETPTLIKIAPLPSKRKHYGRDYRPDDFLLVEEMHILIGLRKATSAEDAARAVVSRAQGAGGESSKVARLALRYREKYGVQS